MGVQQGTAFCGRGEQMMGNDNTLDSERKRSPVVTVLIGSAKAISITLCGGICGGSVAFSTITVLTREMTYASVPLFFVAGAVSGIVALLIWSASHKAPLRHRRNLPPNVAIAVDSSPVECPETMFALGHPDGSRHNSRLRKPSTTLYVLLCAAIGITGGVVTGSVSFAFWWFVVCEAGGAFREVMNRGVTVYCSTAAVGTAISVMACVYAVWSKNWNDM